MENEWTREIERLKEQIIALTAELDAWKSVFGTSQLTHAQARLEQAEKEINAAKNLSGIVAKDQCRRKP